MGTFSAERLDIVRRQLVGDVRRARSIALISGSRLLPPLLQPPGYAEYAVQATTPAGVAIDDLVRGRLGLQETVFSDTEFSAILTQTMLTAVGREQSGKFRTEVGEHLARLAMRNGISLRVLPDLARPHEFTDCQAMILQGGDLPPSGVAYTGVGSGFSFGRDADPQTIQDMGQAMNRLCDMSWPMDASRRYFDVFAQGWDA